MMAKTMAAVMAMTMATVTMATVMISMAGGTRELFSQRKKLLNKRRISSPHDTDRRPPQSYAERVTARSLLKKMT